MLGEQLLGRLGDLDGLGIAPDKCEHGAIAVAPHAADEGDVDVNGLPRLKPRAFDPEAHSSSSMSDQRRGRRRRYASARNSRAAATMLVSAGFTSSHLRVFRPQSGLIQSWASESLCRASLSSSVISPTSG